MRTCPTKVKVALASALIFGGITLGHGLKPMLRGLLPESSVKHWFGLIVLSFLFVTSSTCIAQQRAKNEAKRPFRENVTLPVDSNLLKRFGTAEDLLSDQRWAEATSILQEIAETESKTLVLVQPGKVDGVATYVNVATRCSVLLSQIPTDGRIAYRRKVDPQAKRWFETWQRTRDEAELLRIVRQAFVSSYADDALLALGEAAWDRGDCSAARSSWEQLIPLADGADATKYPTVLRYPDSDLDPASIKSRIILCSIMERELVRATDELQQFFERYPLAEGNLAGQSGRFTEILRKTLDQAQEWNVTPSAAEVATFGLSPERYQKIPEALDVGALRWVQTLPLNVLPSHPERLPFRDELLSYHPVVYDNGREKIVIVNDPDAIRAWNILTGEPAWKSEQTDPAVIYPAFPDEPAMISKMNCVGIPHYTMTIDAGRLFARMGSPVTCSSTAELRRDLASDLVCLDLTQEGKLVWKIAAHELFPDAPTWRYEGSPLVLAGRAYVAVCRRHPQLELMVACLDASNGRLLWQRPIGAYRASVDENNNRISHLLLTAGGGRIFLSTEAGAILALDAHDGRLEWAISYESRSEEPRTLSNDSSHKGLTPALYHAGLLFVAAADANSALCLEADSGMLRWQFPYLKNSRRDTESKQLSERQWKHLLGVAQGGIEGRLIVSGNSLWAIDIQTGQIAWSSGHLARGDQVPFGRGLIAGDQILLPLRESIDIFDLQLGQRTRTVPLKTADSVQQGGNLTIAGGMLLVAQPNRLSAYCEYSQIKERLEKELTHKPVDARSRIRLAELDASEGHLDSAVVQFRRLLEQIDAEDPEYCWARDKFSRLLHEAGLIAFREGKLIDARDQWREALSAVDDLKQQIDLRFDLARAEEALDHPEAALAELQAILDDDRLASAFRTEMTAGHEATMAMSKIIDVRGRDVYREIESAASTAFAAISDPAERARLHRLTARYPNAIATNRARNLLVQWHGDAGETSEAYATIHESRRAADDKHAFAKTTRSMIELLERAGYWDSTRRLRTFLTAFESTMKLDTAGTERNPVESTDPPLNQNDVQYPSSPSRLERTWSQKLHNSASVAIPEGDPPSAELAAAIICFKIDSSPESWKWQCLDWRTGKIRWEETASAPITTVVWTPVHLLIGTQNGWQARTAESGRSVWQLTAHAATKTLIASDSNESKEHSFWPAFFDLDQGLQLFDPNDGHPVARLKPPGQLNGIIGFGNLKIVHARGDEALRGFDKEVSNLAPDRISGQLGSSFVVYMQTVKPTRHWRATRSASGDEWSLGEISVGGEAWQETPMILENRTIGITTANSLVGCLIEEPDAVVDRSTDPDISELQPPSNCWMNRNLSNSFVRPTAFRHQDKLLVIVDGSRLTFFSPTTGVPKWSTGLTDFPMNASAEQLSRNEDCVFAASQGVLRAISINDGRVQFERYLGASSEQWRTAIAWSAGPRVHAPTKSSGDVASQSLVAAWPINPEPGQSQAIRVCDGTTGTIIQQLRVDGKPQGILLDHAGVGILWTDQSVSGVRLSSSTPIAKVGSILNH